MKLRSTVTGETADVSKDEQALEIVNVLGAAEPVDVDAIVEQPAQALAEAEVRHAAADTEHATLQEKRQAAVEKQYFEDNPRALVHEAPLPVKPVADPDEVDRIKDRQEVALASLQSNDPLTALTGNKPADKQAATKPAERPVVAEKK